LRAKLQWVAPTLRTLSADSDHLLAKVEANECNGDLASIRAISVWSVNAPLVLNDTRYSGNATQTCTLKPEVPLLENNRRILLIDDNPTVLKAFSTILELHPSWEVIGKALNGIEGIALFKAFAPNVVVVDYQMPGMTGIDVGRQLRKMGFQGLLILFSLHAGNELDILAEKVGFDAVLPKTTPYPIVGIIEKMQGNMSHSNAAIGSS
jgi:CheY-like chemotaxis protein